MTQKGIILAGGTGSRLFPCTLAMSKQLLPIYDKPAIYYPLSVLMLANIRDICIISTPRDIPIIESLLKDGSSLGINISYIIQEQPNGIAEAFILAEHKIANSRTCLILGDNIFYGNDFVTRLEEAAQKDDGAMIFGYGVDEPERYGVIDFNSDGTVAKIVEKPAKAPSNYAVTGLYFYDENVSHYAKQLRPSKRGELEITDLNNLYLEKEKLFVTKLGRGICWFDVGTNESLLECSNFVKAIETRQGVKIGCIEEIALRKKWIQPLNISASLLKAESSYCKYLRKVIAELEQGQ